MAQRIKRSSKRTKEITYKDWEEATKGRDLNNLTQRDFTELEQLGFGDWIGRNWGNALQVAGGAALALTTPLTGPAGLAGIGMMTSGVSGMAEDASQQKQIKSQNEQTAQMEQQQMIANKTNEIYQNATPSYGAVMRCGGRIKKMRRGGKIEEPETQEEYLQRLNKHRTISFPETEEQRAIRQGEIKPASFWQKVNMGVPDNLRNAQENLYKVGKNLVIPTAALAASMSGAKIPAMLGSAYLGDKLSEAEDPYMEGVLSLSGFVKDNEAIKRIGGMNDLKTSYNDLKEGNYGSATQNFLAGVGGVVDTSMLPKAWAPTRFVRRIDKGLELLNKIGDAVDVGVVAHTAYKNNKKQMGGTINYEGQLHEGPDGGIPVDQMGNPSQNPVALTEGKEVAYDAGEQGSYVFSDTLKFDKNKTFADASKRIQGKYKMRGKNRAGNFNVIDPIAKKGYDKEMQELIEKQETLKSIIQPQEEMQGLPKYDGRSTQTNFITGGAPGHINRNTFKIPYPDLNLSQYDNVIMNPYDSEIDWNWQPPKTNPLQGQDFGIQGSNNFSTPADAPVTSQFQGMNPWQTAAAMAPGVVSGLINIYRGRKGNREENPYKKLNLPTIQAEQINLERERAALREQGNVARANTSRGLRGAAPTAGSYMANMIAGETGIQRGVGQGLGESFTKEETTNAQMRQQVAAANQQMKAQEQMYNNQLDAQWRAQNDALISGGISQIGQGVTSGLMQQQQSKKDAQMLQMQNPDFNFTQSYTPSSISEGKPVRRWLQNWSRRNFGQTVGAGLRDEVVERNKTQAQNDMLDKVLRAQALVGSGQLKTLPTWAINFMRENPTLFE